MNSQQVCNNLKYIFTVIRDDGFTAVVPVITVSPIVDRDSESLPRTSPARKEGETMETLLPSHHV